PGSTAHQLHELQERKHPTRAWPKSYCRTKRRGKILHPPRNIRSTGTSLHGEIEKAEEHTSELQSRENLVCRLLLEKKNIDQSKHQGHFIGGDLAGRAYRQAVTAPGQGCPAASH